MKPSQSKETMPAALNNDILSHIVSILSEEYHEPYDPGHPYIQTETERINIKRAQEAKHALLVLRCTCRFLASSITSVFFSNLTISKINKEAAKHLKRMRQSAFIPLNVKTFILKPTIVHTASGASQLLSPTADGKYNLVGFKLLMRSANSGQVKPLPILRRFAA